MMDRLEFRPKLLTMCLVQLLVHLYRFFYEYKACFRYWQGSKESTIIEFVLLCMLWALTFGAIFMGESYSALVLSTCLYVFLALVDAFFALIGEDFHEPTLLYFSTLFLEYIFVFTLFWYTIGLEPRKPGPISWASFCCWWSEVVPIVEWQSHQAPPPTAAAGQYRV